MKKLAKKQMGGTPKKPVSGQIPTIKKEIKGEQAERMKPYGKQEKFDASKVSKNGLKIKGAFKIGSDTYKPDTTRYKKTGGQGPANKIGKMVKISKKK
jgi:hypothetical protein